MGTIPWQKLLCPQTQFLLTLLSTQSLFKIGLLFMGGDEEEGYYLPESPNPPYVACMFSRTSEDGGSEWLGFPKGKFMMPSMDGSTKQDSVEFSSDETEGEFMPREIDGIDKRTPFII